MSLNPPLAYSADGLVLTESFEGYSDTAYPDPVSGGDPWTIGYGHTAGVRPGDTCTKDQALEWLQADVQAVAQAINDDCTYQLDQPEFDALEDFGFNLGVHREENSTLWTKLMAGDLTGAEAEFDKWDMAGNHVVKGLLRRRQAEEQLFKEGDPNGQFTGNTSQPVEDADSISADDSGRDSDRR